MNKLLIISSVALMFSFPVMAEENNTRTMADLPDEAMTQLNTLFTDYSRCMQETQLQATSSGQQAQQNADDILQVCEAHLDTAKTLMIDNDISEGLAIGMTNNMRSRSARQLMARSMNSMAAQAAAMENAEQSETP